MPSARIHLPLRDITTIILFDETTTAQLIILRAIDKLKVTLICTAFEVKYTNQNALGDELNPVNLGLCTKTGALIDNDKILMQDDSIKLDIDRGQQPNLKIIHLEDKAPPNTASSGVVVEKRLSRSISSYGNGNNNLILKNTMLSSEQMKRRSFSCSTITSAGASTRNDLIQDENERPSVIGLSQIMRNTHLRTRESNGIYRCEKFNVTIIIGDNSRLLMEVDGKSETLILLI